MSDVTRILSQIESGDPDERLLTLNDALTRLAPEDPVAARVVELQHFTGLGHEEVASVVGITVDEARQKWTDARAWLRHDLQDELGKS